MRLSQTLSDEWVILLITFLNLKNMKLIDEIKVVLIVLGIILGVLLVGWLFLYHFKSTFLTLLGGGFLICIHSFIRSEYIKIKKKNDAI